MRLLRNYTQEYLASELEISQKAYSNLESGKTKIDVVRLSKICRILEIPVENIIRYNHKVFFELFNKT
ncbi:MAG: helix-turn-helix transcriptional regulator [Bacteroidota bacterium]